MNGRTIIPAPARADVKERPMSFPASMITALMAGTKTQMRVAMEPQMVYGDVCGLFPSWYLPTSETGGILYPNGRDQILAMCPHGQPGDRLPVSGNLDVELEIVSVRIEALNNISEADARAEGCSASGWAPSYSNPDNAGCDESMSAADAFAELWELINGTGAWAANPWCWVLEFRRVQP